jgi:anti-sigma regulatory factor (Ser/Thr protein kinase)
VVVAERSMLCTRDVDGPSNARTWVAESFDTELDVLVLEAVQLIVSELVTNAIRHAHGEIELCVAVADRVVRIEVSDESPECEAAKVPLDDTLGSKGRGLRLVEAFSKAWGCSVGPQRKVVWAEVRFVR